MDFVCKGAIYKVCGLWLDSNFGVWPKTDKEKMRLEKVSWKEETKYQV